MNIEENCSFHRSFSKLFVEEAYGTLHIFFRRDKPNNNTENFPQTFCKSSTASGWANLWKFFRLIEKRLLPFFGIDSIDDISRAFAKFLRLFQEELQFKEVPLKNVRNNLA